MNQAQQRGGFGEAGAGGAASAQEKWRHAGETAPTAASYRLAGDLLLHALARRLIVVEERCGCYSEYFLG
jgi:hypothetical protein